MKAEIDLLKAEVLELRKDAAISSEMLQQAETRAKVGVSCQALLTSLHMIRTRGLWHALTLPSTHDESTMEAHACDIHAAGTRHAGKHPWHLVYAHTHIIRGASCCLILETAVGKGILWL